ncbi:hypothetical protein BJ912DRAFT_1067829 [Pholiota molesta]|nr:hypothetical protein BJ912DRAFT_1067829 [Pholiota molesta]
MNLNTTSTPPRPADRIPAPPLLCLSTRSRLTQNHTRRADSRHSDVYPTAPPGPTSPRQRYTRHTNLSHRISTAPPSSAVRLRSSFPCPSTDNAARTRSDWSGTLRVYLEYRLEKPRLGGYVVLARRYVSPPFLFDPRDLHCDPAIFPKPPPFLSARIPAFTPRSAGGFRLAVGGAGDRVKDWGGMLCWGLLRVGEGGPVFGFGRARASGVVGYAPRSGAIICCAAGGGADVAFPASQFLCARLCPAWPVAIRSDWSLYLCEVPLDALAIRLRRVLLQVISRRARRLTEKTLQSMLDRQDGAQRKSQTQTGAHTPSARRGYQIAASKPAVDDDREGLLIKRGPSPVPLPLRIAAPHMGTFKGGIEHPSPLCSAGKLDEYVSALSAGEQRNARAREREEELAGGRLHQQTDREKVSDVHHMMSCREGHADLDPEYIDRSGQIYSKIKEALESSWETPALVCS